MDIDTIFSLSFRPTDRHVSSFHILAIVKNVAVNMGMQMYLRDSLLITFSYIPRRRTGRLCGRSQPGPGQPILVPE